MQVRLLVQKGRTSSQELTLSHFPALVGRHKDCNLRITSRLVSREHCIFRERHGWLTVHDLGSSNGTLLNGEAVAAESLVRCGDLLEIGSVVFEAQYEHPSHLPEVWDQDSDMTVIDSSVEAEFEPLDEAEPAEDNERWAATSDTIADEPTFEFRATGEDSSEEDEASGDTAPFSDPNDD